MTDRFKINEMPEPRKSGFDFSHLVGNFLVASPHLTDGPFARTVVLVLQQNRDGVFGVIVNRLANAEMKKSWIDASGSSPVEAEHLRVGGPVSGPIFALHRIESLAEVTVEPGVFLSATHEAINKIIHSGEERYRIFCGVASWKPRQLAEELARGVWFPLDADPESVFPMQEIGWEGALVQYGENMLRSMLRIESLPDDPEMN